MQPRLARIMTGAGALCLLAGCQSPLAGTWKMAPGQSATQVSVAVMTLAGDGTFTAQAQYGNNSEVMSGWWEYADNELIFMTDAGTRSYGAMKTGDELTITHQNTAVTLLRTQPKKAGSSYQKSGMAGANP